MAKAMAPAALQDLAGLFGVETEDLDEVGVPHQVSAESLVAILRVLGATLTRLEEVPAALRERRQQLARRLVEPVLVAWDGKLPSVELRLPLAESRGHLGCQLRWEN